MTTALRGAPTVIYAAYDRRYHTTTVYASRWAAERERSREPAMIDVVEYALRAPNESDGAKRSNGHE